MMKAQAQGIPALTCITKSRQHCLEASNERIQRMVQWLDYRTPSASRAKYTSKQASLHITFLSDCQTAILRSDFLNQVSEGVVSWTLGCGKIWAIRGDPNGMQRFSPNLKEQKMFLLWVRQDFTGWLSLSTRRIADHLPQQSEVGLMCYQGQHDQICIKPIEAVPLVGLVAWLKLGPPDVLHDLVLAFSRDVMPCKMAQQSDY